MWQGIALAVILLAAASLRLGGLDWDGYNHYHPDERYIAWVATTIEAPVGLGWDAALNPRLSTFNPFYWPPGAESEGIVVLQDQPRNFAYGHVPLYMGVVATRLVEAFAPTLRSFLPSSWALTRDVLNAANANEFRHLTAVARALTALLDVATVGLVFLLGRSLFSTNTGLFAAALLSFNVQHIQLAHFFTVDPYLTFFATGAVLLAVASVQRQAAGKGSLAFLLLAAVVTGLAIGSKFSAVMLYLPLTIALWLDRSLDNVRLLGQLALLVLVTIVTFIITNPFALLDLTCEVITPAQSLGPVDVPALDWRSCHLQDVAQQSAMVRGDLAFPFTRQYEGTLAYVYPIVMQLRWGMGPLLGVVSFAGLAWAAWRGLARRWPKLGGSLASDGELVTLAWTMPYFLVTGSFFVKFMRYMEPLTPFLAVYAAALLLSVKWRRLRYGLATLVLIGTVVYALAFTNLYSVTHPWDAASRWIYENVEPGKLILSERWDDALPSTMVIDGALQRRQQYDNEEINWLSGIGTGDDRAKLESNLQMLAVGDYLVIASNRSYGVMPRLPAYYPLSGQFHEQLFAEELGYELVYAAARNPRLGGFWLWPERFGPAGLQAPGAVRKLLSRGLAFTFGPADESFTVYDQPLVMIFSNNDHLTVDEMIEKFDLK